MDIVHQLDQELVLLVDAGGCWWFRSRSLICWGSCYRRAWYWWLGYHWALGNTAGVGAWVLRNNSFVSDAARAGVQELVFQKNTCDNFLNTLNTCLKNQGFFTTTACPVLNSSMFWEGPQLLAQNPRCLGDTSSASPRFGSEQLITFVAMATPDDLNANAEFIRLADSFVEVPGAAPLRVVCWGSGEWLLVAEIWMHIAHHEHSCLNSLDIVKLSPSDISTIFLDHIIHHCLHP